VTDDGRLIEAWQLIEDGYATISAGIAG